MTVFFLFKVLSTAGFYLKVLLFFHSSLASKADLVEMEMHSFAV